MPRSRGTGAAATLNMTMRTFLSFSAMTVWLITVGVSAQNPAPAPTFRSSVDIVTVHTTVRDREGRPLKGLRQGDFTVLDNGQQRAIRMFQADDAAAVSAAFLVDVSGSMSEKLPLAQDVLRNALQAMRSGHDEAALFTFDTRVDERQRFTRDFGGLSAVLQRIEPFGSTSLYDMVADTAERVKTSPSAHAALVVITDGFDTSSTKTAREVAAIANAANIPIYVVATTAPSDKEAVSNEEGTARPYGVDLRDLAAWSGGDVLVASTPLEAHAAAGALVQELRHQYVLGIDAAATSEWRRVEVQVRKKGAIVRARSGYFGKSGRS
jgi:VWFA-related protein